jgi:hypothetical protein
MPQAGDKSVNKQGKSHEQVGRNPEIPKLFSFCPLKFQGSSTELSMTQVIDLEGER